MSDLYAQELRGRYDAALPDVPVDPAPILRRGRRRRRVRVGAGVAAVLAVVVGGSVAFGLVTWPRPAPVAPPPEEPSDVSLWLSSDRVPPGDVELAAVLVNTTSERADTAVPASVDRWDGDSWEPYRDLPTCGEWPCTRRVEPLGSSDAPPLAILPGEIMRFSTAGLEPGWYRVSQGPARGVFEVARGADEPAPLWDVDQPAISVQPALVPLRGGSVMLTPLIPSDGTQSADDAAAAVEGLSDYAEVQRWDGSAWAGTGQVEVRVPATEQPPFEEYADIPGLEPGAYRLVRTGPDGDHTGNFWVPGAPTPELQDVTILDRYSDLPPEAAEQVRTAGAMYAFGAVVHLDRGTIEIYTTGSSSCPDPPTAMAVRGDGTVVVYLGDPDRDPEEVCTADASPTTYVIALPDSVVGGAVLDVELRWRVSGWLIAVSRGAARGDAEHVTILEQSNGLPPELGDPAALPNDGWVYGADVDLATRTIRVWTTGTWGCPNPPTAIEVRDGVVVVYLGTEEVVAGYCNNDEVDHVTYVIAFPDGFAPTEVPTVELRHRRDGSLVGGPEDTLWDDPCVDGQDDAVCALNLWLDELLVGAGYETGAWDSQWWNGSKAVVFGGLQTMWAEAFPAGATSEVLPLEFTPERTVRVGVVDVVHGTYAGQNGGPGAEFTCDGVWLRFVGSVVPPETVAVLAEDAAAQIDACPASVDELVERYADVMNP